MNNSNSIFTRIRIFLILVIFLMAKSLAAGELIPGDSVKKSQLYDINDPRNPECPCHKFQKLADEEYAALLKKQNAIERGISSFGKENQIELAGTSSGNFSEANSGPFEKNKSNRKDKIRRTNPFSYFKHSSKRKIKKQNCFRHIFENPHIHFWKRNTNLNSCFSWK